MSNGLKGIKILDMSRVLAGPFATMVLSDLGAEVIKVERAGSGDDSRQFGPHQNGESAYFMSINRNKKSIIVDLKSEEGKKVIFDLVKEVDVVLENFRPGTMDKLGLGYEDLKEVKPDIIYTAISGFGHSGPYSRRPAYDGVVQAMGGIMSITGSEESGPTRVGPSIGDLAAGLYGVIGTLTAIIEKMNTGKGQKVDVAMLDCQVSLLENAVARYQVYGQAPTPIGNKHSSIVPFEPFKTKNSEIMLAVGNDAIWKRFLGVTNAQELMDERFDTNPKRHEHYKVLRPLIAKIMLTKETKEWQEILDQNGIPNGPINTIDKLFEDEHVEARNMLVEVDHPVAGRMKIPGNPIKMTNIEDGNFKPSPNLGEHTEDVLKEILNYSDEEIKKYTESL